MSPILKWVGGKRSILPALDAHLPTEINDYYEPFVGGAAVFCRIRDRIQGRAHLSDLNQHLSWFYNALISCPDEVIEEYETLLMLHCKETFYAVRDEFNRNSGTWTGGTMSGPEHAARFLYLNTAGFNGLWRVNKNGLCNVPYGGNERTPKDPDEVRGFAKQIEEGVSFDCRPYTHEYIQPTLGDLVYCDPPYTGTFKDYTSQGWEEADDYKLRDKCIEWVDAGARVIVTVGSPRIWEQILEFEVFPVESSSKIKRKPRTEYIVVGG